jgi:hypothetical protein
VPTVAPGRRAARRLIALWEFLRPFAVALSVLAALFVDVVIGRALWDELHLILILLLCALAFIPIMLAAYTLLSFPVNALIGMARFDED